MVALWHSSRFGGMRLYASVLLCQVAKRGWCCGRTVALQPLWWLHVRAEGWSPVKTALVEHCGFGEAHFGDDEGDDFWARHGFCEQEALTEFCAETGENRGLFLSFDSLDDDS